MRFACTAARSSGSSAPTSRPRAWSWCSSGRSASRTESRCWPTGGCSTSPTSSGARGFRNDYGWIRFPLPTEDDGYPEQTRGAVPSPPGLYFVGLPFLHSFASMLILGAGRDGEAGRRAHRHAGRACTSEKPTCRSLRCPDEPRPRLERPACERPGSWAGRGTVRRCTRADNRGEGRNGRAGLSGRRDGARRRRCARPSTASR